MEALGIPSTLFLTVNQKQHHIPRRIAKINANTRDLKEAGVAIPNISIYLSCLAYAEDVLMLDNAYRLF